MKRVGVREFRDHATAYLSGSEPIAVTKHGRVIGIYIPLETDENDLHRAVDQASQILSHRLQDPETHEEERAWLIEAGIQLCTSGS